jgi:hypothetical protein
VPLDAAARRAAQGAAAAGDGGSTAALQERLQPQDSRAGARAAVWFVVCSFNCSIKSV